MERSITFADWLPTLIPETRSCLQLDRLAHILPCISSLTTDISSFPYDPALWSMRATALLNLGYPELADGDAYKCLLLCQSICETREQRPKWMLGFRSGFWMLVDDDLETKNEARSLQLGQSIEWLRSHASDIMFGPERGLTFSSSKKFLPQPYPWLSREHRHRSDGVIKSIEKDLTRQSRQAEDLRGRPRCVLRRHAFGKTFPETRDVLGVFACRDMQQRTTVLVDGDSTFACGKLQGHDSGFGTSSHCVHKNQPNQEDGTKFDLDNLYWVADLTSDRYKVADVILNCRFLIRCCLAQKQFDFQDCSRRGAVHPLDHPAIARMTSSYHVFPGSPADARSCSDTKAAAEKYNINDDIAIPLSVLQRCGIDIFADNSFETWILFEIRARIRTNKWGDAIHVGVNALFSLFNHSCEPNVRWSFPQPDAAPWQMQLITTRDIHKGEQLFVCYDGFAMELSLHERRKRFRTWLNGDCICTRCRREELEAQTGRLENHVGVQDPARNSWDVDLADRPDLPEDTDPNHFKNDHELNDCFG